MSAAHVLQHVHVLTCGQCLQILQDIVSRHQAARALVTDSVVDAFMAIRPMQDACLPRSDP